MSLVPIATTDENSRHIGDVECILWHDGHVISGGDGGKIKIWTPDLKLVTEFQAHDYPIYHLASENKNFYSCSNDSTIREWTNKNGEWGLARTLEAHKQPVRRLRVDGGRLYSGDEAGDIFVWNNGVSEGSFNVSEEIWDMFIEGNKFYTVRDRDVTISQFGKTSSGKCTNINSLEGRGPLRVSGDKLVFVSRDGMDLLVHDNINSGNPLLGRLKGHSMIINAIIGDPSRFFTAGWEPKVIAWDLNKLEKITECAIDGYANCLALSPKSWNDEQILYIGGGNGAIQAIQIKI